MPGMPEMKYIVDNDCVKVELPLTSQGKFRCKNRDNIQDFGIGFAPKTDIITSKSYLEWQIGYDTIIGKDEKNTQLKEDKFIFVGANRKNKHPYELSEITYSMCKLGIIKKEELQEVLKKIDAFRVFLQDKYSIEVKEESPVCFNDVDFLSSSTKLPTFVAENINSKLLIEIMIQKQQYATGVQPMLYLDVPVKAFQNSQNIIGHTSSETPYGILCFDSKLKCTIFDLLTCFGMCSSSHNHDVKEIIKVILKNV